MSATPIAIRNIGLGDGIDDKIGTKVIDSNVAKIKRMDYLPGEGSINPSASLVGSLMAEETEAGRKFAQDIERRLAILDKLSASNP